MDESRAGESPHEYGPRVHLHSDPHMLALLARIGAPDTRPPLLFHLLRAAYGSLLSRAAAAEFPRAEVEVDTRMKRVTPRGVWRGCTVDPKSRVVIANVMRAGNVPSLVCYEELTALFDPDQVRIDHFYLSRRSDEHGHVVGVDSAGSKVGGAIDGAVVVIPDPMGATGRTTAEVVRAYRERDLGDPRALIALHLIITPEYIRRVSEEAPEVRIHAGRVDRGMSSPEVQAEIPGRRIAEESGLDEAGYIVPGAGGLGEVINNAWV